MISRYNEYYLDIRIDDDIFITKTIERYDFSMENLYFGYFELHETISFTGKIDDIRVFHKRITGIKDKYLSYKYYDIR